MFDTRLVIVVDGEAFVIPKGVFSCLFAGQKTAELEEVVVYQSGVSYKVATLHPWVAVMVKTSDREKRDNVFNCYPLHAL